MNRLPSELKNQKTECVSRESLRKYLAGWADDSTAQTIEEHLSQCSTCETVLDEIESECDIRLLRSTAENLSSNESDPVVAKALEAAKNHPVDPSSSNAASSGEVRLDHFSMQPPLDLGPYELIRPLGRGGMGMVYLAKHRRLNKQVAIKLLPTNFVGADVHARFEREIVAAGQLKHPAIVLATDAGQANGVQYLVMEYVDGLDLGRLARAIPKLAIPDVCEIGRQIALGLSSAHTTGMVHRDIKPSNVMLDSDGAVKILDFGLVLLDRWDGVSSELTTIGQFLGTLDYMAPEQAERCGAVDYRADLYSLGATLFRLLCGRAPLAAAPNQSPLEKLRLLANHRPPSLKTVRPDAPEEIVRLVDQLLSTNPNDRPPSADHVAEQLASLAKQSNLAALLKSAKENTVDPALGLPSLPPSPTTRLANATILPSQPSPARSGSGGGIRRFIIAAALLLPILGYAGYMIVLETSKGQLVIESEVADVQVKILRDGQPIRELSIQPGMTSTRLTADQYEITLQSPSDSISIENDRFVVKNHQIVIARIRRVSNGIPNPSSVSASPQVAAPQTAHDKIAEQKIEPAVSTVMKPLYKGKSYDEWLAHLRLETDGTAWMEAFLAVDHESPWGEGRKLSAEVFELAIQRRQLHDPEFCKVFAGWTTPDEFASMILNQFAETPDEKLPNFLPELATAIATLSVNPETWNPVWTRLEKLVFGGDQTSNLYNPGLQKICRSLVDIPRTYQELPKAKPILERAIYVVETFPRLAQEFLLLELSKKLQHVRRDFRSRDSVVTETVQWGQQQWDSLLQYRLKALEATDLNSETRIAMLTTFTDDELDSDETLQRYVAGLNDLFVIASKDNDLLFRDIIDSRELSQLNLKGLRETRTATGTLEKRTPFSQVGSVKTYAVLLFSLERLWSPLWKQPGLDALISATQESYNKIRDKWMKELDVANLSRISITRGSRTTVQVSQPGVLPNGLQIPLEDERLVEIYLCHRWANDLRGTPVDSVESKETPSTQPADSFLYEGKAFDEWLKVFKADLSPNRQKDSFVAMLKIVTPEQQEAFDSVLLEKMKNSKNSHPDHVRVLMKRPKVNLPLVLEIVDQDVSAHSESILQMFDASLQATDDVFDPFWKFLEQRLARTEPEENLSSMIYNFGGQIRQRCFRKASQHQVFDPSMIAKEERAVASKLVAFLDRFPAVARSRNSLHWILGLDAESPKQERTIAFRHLVMVLKNSDTQVNEIGNALLLLSRFAELKEFQTDELRDVLEHLLRRLSAELGLQKSVTGSEVLAIRPLPPKLGILSPIQIVWQYGRLTSILPIILKISSQLPMELRPVEGLRRIAENPKSSAHAFKLALQREFLSKTNEIKISWPDLVPQGSFTEKHGNIVRGPYDFIIHRWANQLIENELPDLYTDELLEKATDTLPGVEERWKKYIELQMKKLDKNGDTVLTEDEWSASNGLFKDADADHDGSVTPIEYYQLKRRK